MKPAFCLAVLISLIALACTTDKKSNDDANSFAGEKISVTISSTAEGVLDPLYIGYAFDTAQFTGGKWWSDDKDVRAVAKTPELENEKFRTLVANLSPALMRIGGTDCDGAYFCPEEGDCTLPSQYADAFFDDENRKESFFTHEDIRRGANFAESVGAEIMFCLNFGSGPRNPETGDWQPDNARQLMEFIKSLPQADLFKIWEAGNESNAIGFHFKLPAPLTPELYVSDLAVLRNLIDDVFPGGLLAGPGSYYYPNGEFGGDFTASIMPAAADYLDLLTWHLYATQSESCGEGSILRPYPAGKENLFSEEVIDLHIQNAGYARAAANGLPVLNGESASAQCGGQRGVSDTMLDALWYTDWIGLMAREGTRGVVRQTLVGSDYGIIDPHTYDPRPTFLALVLYRRLIAEKRFAVEVSTKKIKAHAYCDANNCTGKTAVIVNPEDKQVLAEISDEGGDIIEAESWTLSANGDLAADRATINGIGAGTDGSIPEIPGKKVALSAGSALAEVEPASVVFVHYLLAATQNKRK